ncbi:MAG: alkaline phosphatase family protein [Planctomycetota bacterium]|jgi:predicted AlkP superfamily phosphohydrolase/phosphomutase
MNKNKNQIPRRSFIKGAGLTLAGVSAGLCSVPESVFAGSKPSARHPKVIVIGFDGMDPFLTEKMMDAGQLPTLASLRKSNGYRRLATSNPPQSPVAWANFINGAGPGTHGIFDFIHRDPAKQCAPFFSAAETVEGEGSIGFGEHQIQLNFWPFNHSPTQTLLRREGTPFWNYLDAAGIQSAFYDLPSNYPPSKSQHGHHCCLAGMGTPDLLGTYGTYQHYAEDGPVRTKEEPGGMRSMLFFENETAPAKLIGPMDSFLKEPVPITIDFQVHRDLDAAAAVIELQKHTVLLKEGDWSPWIQLDFPLSMPGPDKHLSGICRFYLQEVAPNFRLYVTPVNVDPSNPATPITEPEDFSKELASRLGLFYTTGFQEDHKALSNKVFNEAEFAAQAQIVLDERINLLNDALKNYEDGLLFFYFSSTDLQSHMFWWDSDQDHPARPKEQAQKYFEHIKDIYRTADSIVSDMIDQYGNEARILVMSDHGFANFRRQFNLNTWLRDNGYLGPADATSIMSDVDWSKTKAFGLGINGLYLNLQGREKYGIVTPEEKDALLDELVQKLEAVRDGDGSVVIKKVRRSDKTYKGPHTAMAPDLIIGYKRGYRGAWTTCLGDMDETVFSDNDSAWGADHCGDSTEVPGILFSNKPITKEDPALIDLAPTILNEFGLEKPDTMTGKNIF